LKIASHLFFQLSTLSFVDDSFPVLIFTCLSNEMKTCRKPTFTSITAPGCSIPIQKLGKNNLNLVRPVDSCNKHPRVKEVLLSDLLRSEGEMKNNAQKVKPFSFFCGSKKILK